MSVVVCSGMFAISITLEYVNNLVLIKKLANQGYRYEEFKLFNFHKLFPSFIPFINVVSSMKRFIKINSSSPILVAQNIIAMTEEEKEKYNSNPSLITAIELNRNSEIMPDMVLIYTENEQSNTIYFKQSEDRYVITSSKGPVSKFSKEKQYESLKSNLDEINCVKCKKIVQSKPIMPIKKELSYFRENVIGEYPYDLKKEKVYVKKYPR